MPPTLVVSLSPSHPTRLEKDGTLNPLDELRSLTGLFPGSPSLIAEAEHIPSALTPEPYRTMLVHNEHMTVTMEAHHGTTVDVRVIAKRLDGDVYSREIVLLKSGTDRVVQFGIVRFHLHYVTAEVRDEILAERTPLGRGLIEHNVLRHIDLGAVLRITAATGLADLLQMPENGVTYGRLATIFCNRKPAVDLLEISAPLT